MKLDNEGRNLLDKKIYYEYRFTPKINGTYKIPNGKIWTNNNSFDMFFNDSIKLEIPEPITKLSVSDSIALALKIEEENFRIKEKRRAECDINSRIPDNNNKIKVLLWADNMKYKVNNEIRIVAESNRDFDYETLKINLKNNLGTKLEFLGSCITSVYENGKEKHHTVFTCKSLETGIITISPFKIKIGNRKTKTNTLWFEITEN